MFASEPFLIMPFWGRQQCHGALPKWVVASLFIVVEKESGWSRGPGMG